MRQQLAVVALASACCLAGCSSEEVMLAHSVKLVPETRTIPQNQLLDVGVVVFDPGVPDGQVAPEVKEKLVREGTFVQVRRAESMYMAVQLRDTLENSGHWGSVWVTPQTTTAADLNVTTKILQSDGDLVKLHAQAVDSTGRVWLDKSYTLETTAGAYNRQRYPNLDPYQDVFNEIANDLAAAQDQMRGDDMRQVRRVAALRYADDLSPEAFAGYVDKEKDGRYALERLPATDDPMFTRTEQVRQRERLFMDTLNEHYTKFANDAQDSYDGWRQSSREEAISIHELQKSARWRTGLGIASILASVVYGTSSGHDAFSDRVITDALMYMGTDVLKSAAVRRQEKRVHTQSLEELSSSFNDSVEPLVVDIKGTQHRLTGTVEAQYEEWRDLLRRMFVTETGFGPDDLKVYEDPQAAKPDSPLDSGAAGAGAGASDGAAGGSAAPKDTAAPATATKGAAATAEGGSSPPAAAPAGHANAPGPATTNAAPAGGASGASAGQPGGAGAGATADAQQGKAGGA